MHINNQATAPRYVRGAERALADLEPLRALSLPITREDDWALMRALAALREIVESNTQTMEGSV